MDHAHALAMSGTYDLRLVALSVLLAMGASYAALDLSGRVTASRHWGRAIWLVGGAIAMGLGIFAMHYVGMLALSMPMPILFDLPTVALSLLVAIAASAVALYFVSRRTMGAWPVIAGSLVMGSGIAAMHYIGMAAMRVQAHLTYNLWIVALSVALAVAVSMVALILTFRLREETRATRRKLFSAVVMGSAIPLMHYTGMAAAHFSPSDNLPDLSHAISISNLGITAIGITTLLILVLSIASSLIDRMLAAKKAVLETSREAESHFRLLAEAIPQIIWTADSNGNRDYVNQRWQDYTGLELKDARSDGWQSTLHADDRRSCQIKWDGSVTTGETFEMEYRIRRALDEMYRWHLARAIPVREPDGRIIKWFGTCTDIHDQRQHRRILEDQIKERTAEVVAANAQLKREMWEREQVQQDLDQQNVAMVDDFRKRSDRAALLTGMSKLLQSADNVNEATRIALGFAPRIFPDFRGALILLNQSRSLLEVAGTWADCEVPASATFETSSCWALRTGQKHFVEKGDLTAPCSHAETAKSSYLCVPIMTQGGATGILHLQSIADSAEPFEGDLLLISSFAEHVGLAISSLRLQEALRKQSIKDTLTGLYNRRHMDESLERELRRAARADHPVGIIMLDLDHFKNFNDRFGHEAGDSVLREMGNLLSRNVRAEDIPCRFGGEEFFLILPGTDLRGAGAKAERLRNQVKKLAVVHQGTSVGMITISVGVAAFPMHGLVTTDLIGAADAALYRAKKDGSDRVVVTEELQSRDGVAASVASHS